MIKGRCESCNFWNGQYCCGGYLPDEDLTIDEIISLNKQAEENGLSVSWRLDHCDSWQEYEEDDWEDVTFDNWRERYEE